MSFVEVVSGQSKVIDVVSNPKETTFGVIGGDRVIEIVEMPPPVAPSYDGYEETTFVYVDGVLAEVHKPSLITFLTYDAEGQLIYVDTGGVRRVFNYDAEGLLVLIEVQSL